MKEDGKQKALTSDFLQCFPQTAFAVSEFTRGLPFYRKWLAENDIPGSVIRNGWHPDILKASCVRVDKQDVWTLVLNKREDFARCISTFGRQCRPIELPEEIGAMTIFNVRNWKKTEDFRTACKNMENSTWREQLAAALKEHKQQLTDHVILLTVGEYSHVPCTETPWDEKAWKEYSLDIRTYHELAHVYSRTFYPLNREAIRDEVIADAIGLVYATGEYSAKLAARLIGVSDKDILENGRINHYRTDDMAQLHARIWSIIYAVRNAWVSFGRDEPMSFLDFLESNRVGMQQENQSH